jgi:hypothetical protein
MSAKFGVRFLPIAFAFTLAFPKVASATTIYACYGKILGVTRIVSGPNKCDLALEIPISWNQQGPQGTSGPTGSQGLQGPVGAAGTQGPQGPQGPQGLAGPTGATGPAGPAGTPLPTCTAPDFAVLYRGQFICNSTLPHYVDNSDGTVTDNVTGLMWEKKTGAAGIANTADVHDVNNFYTWTATGTAADGPLFDTFLTTLNGGDSYDLTTGQHVSNGPGAVNGPPCFAHHCDWRIPTVAELSTIIETSTAHGCGVGGFCIDPIFGAQVSSPPPYRSLYWSSSSSGGNPYYAWYVDFFDGVADNNAGKNNNLFARAVRGGP